MAIVPQYFYSKDDVLGYKLSENFKGVTQTREFKTNIDISSEGFRDYEHSRQKKDGTYRIIGLGDSFTFGFGVPFEETYLRILEKKLNQSSSNRQQYEIIKTGIPGYCLLQEFLLLKKKGADYKPDLVLVGFDVNDHVDSIEPFDTVRDGFLIKRDSLQSPLLEERIFIYKNFQSIYLIAKTFKIIKNKLFKNKQARILYDEQLRNEYKQKALSFTSQLLQEIQEFCRQREIKILLVFIPHKSQVHPDICKPTLFSHYFSGLDSFLEQACRENNIAYLNLLPSLESSAKQGEQLYFDIDGHWNSNGHRLAAELIFEKLTKLLTTNEKNL
jgi:lysophospholipase L1-like esterase